MAHSFTSFASVDSIQKGSEVGRKNDNCEYQEETRSRGGRRRRRRRGRRRRRLGAMPCCTHIDCEGGGGGLSTGERPEKCCQKRKNY